MSPRPHSPTAPRASVWRCWRAGFGALALVLAAPLARADLWAFVDERGVVHFASERLDARYELFHRGPDPRRPAPAEPVHEPLPRPVAVPTAPPRLLAYLEISPTYKSVRHLLREAAARHDLDYELIKAVIATESGFDPQAVSPRGAVGLMQLLPTTAEQHGVTGDARASVAQKLTDPRTNIAAGTRHLRELLNRFAGELELALAAYNAGEGAVRRAGNRVPDYRETQNYVRTVMQIYAILKPPKPVVQQRAETRSSPALLPAPGGAIGRGNMIPPLGTQPLMPAPAALPATADPARSTFY